MSKSRKALSSFFNRFGKASSKLVAQAAIGLIRGYRFVFSSLLPFNHCRFYPSCSHYAEEAFHKHNALKALGLSVWRVLRCQPLNRKHGYDPVP